MVVQATKLCSLCFLLGSPSISKSSIERHSGDASVSWLKQNTIHLSVDCWIKTNVPKETAARFGRLLFVKTIIFETSDAFSRRLIVTFIKPNANFPLLKSSLQSAPNSLLKRNDKFIVVSRSRAPDESVSNKEFQLVVNSKSILNSEGALAVPITSYSVYEGAQWHPSSNVTETNGINFGESVCHRVDEKNEFIVDYLGNNPFQQTNLPLIVDNSSKSQLIVTTNS